jgi:hypothetical protein
MVPEYKKFGFIFSIIFSILFILGQFKDSDFVYLYLIFALIFLCVSVLKPIALKFPYIYWLKLGGILGKINTVIILSALFYFLFTPISLILKLIKKDLLGLKFSKKTDTYWVKKENNFNKRDSMKYQF